MTCTTLKLFPIDSLTNFCLLFPTTAASAATTIKRSDVYRTVTALILVRIISTLAAMDARTDRSSTSMADTIRLTIPTDIVAFCRRGNRSGKLNLKIVAKVVRIGSVREFLGSPTRDELRESNIVVTIWCL